MKQGELYYSGTIVEILDRVLYEIKVDIPGLKTGVTAYPMRGEVDEPRVGDFVFLKCLDPVFQSYYLYHKIKENDFIGFRSNGKMVDITPDYIQVAIFDPSNEEWNDFSENNNTDDLGRVCGGYRPEVTDWIRLDKDGNLNIFLRSNSKVVIEGDSYVEITGNSDTLVKSDATITVNGNTVLDCPDVTITGGQLTIRGTSNTDMRGPFNCIPTCPFSGAPHRGSIVTGT